MIVAVAVHFLDDDLALHAREVRQAADPRLVGAGQAGAGAEQDRAGGARRDHRILAPDELGDALRDAILELVEHDEVARGVGHRRVHLGPLLRGPEYRVSTAKVEYRLDSKLLVEV